jgi:hypothetical protein
MGVTFRFGGNFLSPELWGLENGDYKFDCRGIWCFGGKYRRGLDHEGLVKEIFNL